MSTKIKAKANTNTKTIKSTLNAGILTSFLLNSTFLALCNATAATALSAMAAVLGGDAVGSSSAMSEQQSTAANNLWYEMANVSFSNINNNNGSGSSNEMMTLNGGTPDVDYNDSDNLTAVKNREYIFDRTDVRIVFVPLYILVFCCCFFGNLLVILVVTLSRRLRSITNFFLANLALADFCVGLFCVLQNLSIYLIESWVFGKFLCRMYQFVHSLSYTASIFILVVICMERYFAIVHPITCKQILTATRLRLAILTVWVTSAVYSTPKFLFSKTITNIHRDNGHVEVICVLDRKMFNSQVLDIINFGLLYIIPLLVMTVLYSKIAIALWRSSHGLSHHLVTQHQQQQQQQQQDESMSLHNSMYHHHNHHHQQHHQQHQQHIHQQLSYDRHATQMTSSTPTNNTNYQHHNHPHLHHQHYHLPQATTTNAQQQQLLGSELTTSTTVLGVIGMGSVGDTGCGGGGGSGGDAVTCGIGAAAAIGNNMTSGLLSRRQSSKYEKRAVSATESQVSLDSERPIVSACRNGNTHNDGTGSCGGGAGGGGGGSMNSTHKSSFMQHHHNHSSTHPHPHQRNRVAHMPHASNNVLRARRGVVRMLIIFVLTFALCNLPYHARKMWQYWSHSYRGDSNFNALLTPLTFLVTYFNSGINPLLYAFLSRNFRKGMRELVSCSCKKKKSKSSLNSSMHHKRVALQVTHSLPTDTTHIGNEQL